MPSFLKKSSSGARDSAGTWKCLEARFSTSWVVSPMVRMDSQFITIVGGMKIAQASRQGTGKLRPSGDAIGNWGFIGLTVCICFRGVEKRYRDKDFVRNFCL